MNAHPSENKLIEHYSDAEVVDLVRIVVVADYLGCHISGRPAVSDGSISETVPCLLSSAVVLEEFEKVPESEVTDD